MKKGMLFLIFTLVFLLCAPTYAEQFFGIGAEFFKDPYNNKVILTKIIPNSPVEAAGILAGSELGSVNNQKVKKMTLCELISELRGEDGTEVKLVVRKGWKWQTYNLKRALIVVDEPKIDENFKKHWEQICPRYFLYANCISKEISDKFSRKYKKNILPAMNYWIERRASFEEGYNLCKTYSKNNQELCLINLLNRENDKTIADKNLYKVLRTKPE